MLVLHDVRARSFWNRFRLQEWLSFFLIFMWHFPLADISNKNTIQFFFIDISIPQTLIGHEHLNLRRGTDTNNWPVKSPFNFLSIEQVKTRSHMVKTMLYIGKTEAKPCFGTKHHFPWAPELKNCLKNSYQFPIEWIGQNQVPYCQNDGL